MGDGVIGRTETARRRDGSGETARRQDGETARQGRADRPITVSAANHHSRTRTMSAASNHHERSE